MPMPVRSLPTIQNWDCHTCGDCCRTYAVRVTAEERKRIQKQAWSETPELKGVEPIAFNKQLGDYALAHTPNGDCVFLGENNLCRIHAKFGAAAKPFACRLYPFVLVPAGDHWKVSLRYACPSVTDNLGRSCTAHAADLTDVAKQIEADQPQSANAPAPPLQPGQSVPWTELERFTRAFLKLVSNRTHPIERRLRQVAALVDTCRKAKFDAVRGKRLEEFLQVMSTAMVDEVPADPYSVPKPGWVGRTLFRQQLGVYLRQDHGPHAGVGQRGRWSRFRAGWNFAIGGGVVSRLHADLPESVRFSACEEPLGNLPPEAEELFTRYFRVKLESGQFFGPNNFQRGYWDGLDSLLLVLPMVMWATRLMVAGGRDKLDAVKRAMRMVDENFGHSKFLAGYRTTWALRTLAERGEVVRLIAWYAR
jgi:lysine-N-methylase